jgi:hypothetical protein
VVYRLNGDRTPLTLDGLTIEVQPVVSDTVYRSIVALGAAAVAAPSNDTLSAVAVYFCTEAQPTWDIIDHRGIVPATPAGMLRMSDALALGLVSEWAAAFVAEPPETAVDKIIPPGEMRDELNRRLKAVA